MAEKKVIAYCLHEHELAAIEPHIKNADWTQSYAIGSMEEADIQNLEEQGILIEEIKEPPARPAFAARGPQPQAAGAPAPADLAGDPLPPMLHPTKDNVFVVTLGEPVLLEEWRQQIEALGVRFLERRPNRRYIARLGLAAVGQLRQLPFVADVSLLSPEESTGTTFTTAAEPGSGMAGPPENVPFDILLHEPDDLVDVELWLNDNGVEIVAKGRRKVRVELPRDSMQAREIQALPGVAEVQEYIPPTLANERARRLLGLDPATGTGSLPQTGAGEIVAVADSGLDDQHPAFTGRIAMLIARGRPPQDTSDPHGHGTHVASSALGIGTAVGGVARGTAPDAQLVFQSLMDASGGLGGLPIDLGDLFDEAYQAGARIHNNSWSADTKSFYTFTSREVDEFVYDHPDMLIVIAAGNEGTAQDPFNAAAGFVDWQSIGSPATAKNALTVGASRSDRTSEGLAQKTWRHFNGTRFGKPPIGDDNISGDPQRLAAFSSRGPCDSNRIKPDLVAPGTDILSARASTAPDHNFWALSTDPQYAYMGGTSMAAPLVAGCAALVRQYYRQDRQAEPSAALLKATLVNSTRWLSGPDATADHAKNPNYHQGFGAVYMPFAIPNPTEPWMRLEFVDTWKDGTKQLATTGDRRRFAFTVKGGQFLRICLTWTDPPPGPSLQNALALLLETPLQPPRIAGNHERPRIIDKVDRDNNVQIVRIDNPPPGNYMAVVLARNMLRPPQDYALVVTGDLGPGGLIAV
ncbi:MAG: serine protease AprX [Acidobacteriota bacterium]|jgi:subtilisin family serine protease|nr:serine protease AprX [Acidobacteriota bacterium]